MSTAFASSTTNSSKISETNHDHVLARDGSRCVLCGNADVVDVVHLIARASSSNIQLERIRTIAPCLRNYMKNDPSNLITLCPNHHYTFHSFLWTFMPTIATLDKMIIWEKQDMAARQRLVDQGLEDPGRTLYLQPGILPVDFHCFMRNGGSLMHERTMLNDWDKRVYHLYNPADPYPTWFITASPYALLIGGRNALNNASRKTPISLTASVKVFNLLLLYEQVPVRRLPQDGKIAQLQLLNNLGAYAQPTDQVSVSPAVTHTSEFEAIHGGQSTAHVDSHCHAKALVDVQATPSKDENAVITILAEEYVSTIKAGVDEAEEDFRLEHYLTTLPLAEAPSNSDSEDEQLQSYRMESNHLHA